jgi:hypothetical protein
MKNWGVPILSVLFVLLLVYLSGPFQPFRISMSRKEARENVRSFAMLWTADEEKREENDPYWFQLLVQIQQQLDEWLKSLNERIESKDVSKIEVRFLEVLRNILEWVKEKVDAKIESSRGKGPKRKDLFRETRNMGSTVIARG